VTINPKFVVVDELDLLLNDTAIQKSSLYCLRQMLGQSQQDIDNLGEEESLQNQKKVILTGASMPKRINKVNADEIPQKWFPNNNLIKADGYLKINSHIEQQSYSVEGLSEEDKRYLLVEVLEKESQKSAMVFVSNGT
jgi:superfamily II DNA/RNA helicase